MPRLRAEAAHALLYKKWGYPILRCQSCGLGSTDTDNRFDPDQFYSAAYFDGQYKDGYGDYLGSESVLRAEFRGLVSHLAEWSITGGKLLEIGSAYGFFLLEASRSFESTGLEICEHAVRFCRERGLDVQQGVLSDDFFRGRAPFDAMVMLDVIEHLPDPLETVTLIKNNLRLGGHLVITTGDWDSLFSSVAGRYWRLMTPPQHLYFYSRRTLRTLLRKAGFKILECSRPWKKIPFGLAMYQLLRRFRIPLPLPRKLSNFGVPVNLFDTVRLICRKERT